MVPLPEPTCSPLRVVPLNCASLGQVEGNKGFFKLLETDKDEFLTALDKVWLHRARGALGAVCCSVRRVRRCATRCATRYVCAVCGVECPVHDNEMHLLSERHQVSRLASIATAKPDPP